MDGKAFERGRQQPAKAEVQDDTYEDRVEAELVKAAGFKQEMRYTEARELYQAIADKAALDGDRSTLELAESELSEIPTLH